MDLKIKRYLSSAPSDRQSVLTDIHSVILQEDVTVIPCVEPMMGKEMIVYKSRNMMKYALSSGQKHMTLHVLPIYSSSDLFMKYKALLSKASFQKGCINFKAADEMPSELVRQLIIDCSKIDLVKIREEYLKERKESKKLRK